MNSHRFSGMKFLGSINFLTKEDNPFDLRIAEINGKIFAAHPSHLPRKLTKDGKWRKVKFKDPKIDIGI